jgi:molecular chaperone DnaK (HSP70)
VLGPARGHALDKAAVDRMLAEADAAKTEDHRTQEVLDARTQLNTLLYRARKLLAEGATRIPGEVRARCEAAIRDAATSLEADDLATLRDAFARLQAATHAATEALYRAAKP